jgi:hypothetical protein
MSLHHYFTASLVTRAEQQSGAVQLHCVGAQFHRDVSGVDAPVVIE